MNTLTNIKLPKQFTVHGGIEVLSSDITFDKEPYTGKLENAHFNSRIRTTCISKAYQSSLKVTFRTN